MRTNDAPSKWFIHGYDWIMVCLGQSNHYGQAARSKWRLLWTGFASFAPAICTDLFKSLRVLFLCDPYSNVCKQTTQLQHIYTRSGLWYEVKHKLDAFRKYRYLISLITHFSAMNDWLFCDGQSTCKRNYLCSVINSFKTGYSITNKNGIKWKINILTTYIGHKLLPNAF